jgi:hypothetical protein
VLALLTALPTANPANEVPEGVGDALVELERRMHQAADADALTPYLAAIEDFLACRRREITARRQKSLREWKARAKEIAANVGFDKKAEFEERSLERATGFFHRLQSLTADASFLVNEAVRPRLAVAALVMIKRRG